MGPQTENLPLSAVLDQVDFNPPARSLPKAQRDSMVAVQGKGEELIQACQRVNQGGFLEPRDFGLLFTELDVDTTGAPLVRAATYYESKEGGTIDQLRLVIVSGLKWEHDLDTRLFDHEARQASREASFATQGFGSGFTESVRSKFLDTLLAEHPVALSEETILASIWITRALDPKEVAQLRRDPIVRSGGRENLIDRCSPMTTVSVNIEPESPYTHSYDFKLNAPRDPVRITVPYSVLSATDFDDNPIPRGTLASRTIHRKVGLGDVSIGKALCESSFGWFQGAIEKRLVGYPLPGT